MSIDSFRMARVIAQEQGVTTESLIMAAMQMAAGEDAVKLRACWPNLLEESRHRNAAPDGKLPGE